MSALGRVVARLRAVFLHRRLGREMRAEMELHIEQATARYVERGFSREEALRQARREFGNIGELRERGRDARGARWVGALAGDLQYALRHFARTPGMTITIVLILMLGVTVNAATFAVAEGLVNRPPPGVPDDPALVTIRGTQVGSRVGMRHLSYSELAEYARLESAFESVAGWTTRGVVVDFREDEQDVSAISAQFVTPNYFGLTRVPITGAGFQQSRFDELSSPELNAVISETIALEKFGAVDAALGKTFLVNGYAVTVVGVAPHRFNGIWRSDATAMIWLPLSALHGLEQMSGDPISALDRSQFVAVGRLQAGVSAEQAGKLSQQVATRMQAVTKLSRDTTIRLSVSVVPVRGDLGDLEGNNELMPVVSALSVIVVLILLVCTATVASLLIAASARRRNEIAVRLALGASRMRIIRQLLTETTLLALAAASLGLLAFFAVMRVYASQVREVDITPSFVTVAFTTLVAVAAALLSGLTPALHATRHSLNEVLKDSASGATSRSRLQRAFVVAQVALAQPLLVCLAVFVSIVTQGSRTAYEPTIRSQLIHAEIGIAYDNSPRQQSQLDAVEQRLEALPGVQSVTGYPHGMTLFALETPPAQSDTLPRVLDLVGLMVAPNYFSTMDMSLVRGRTFTAEDKRGSPMAVIIAASLAEQLFPGQDPLGRRLKRTRNEGEVEIIGVVSGNTDGRNSRRRHMHDFRPTIYTADIFSSSGMLLIRMDKPAEPFLPSIRALISSEAPQLPIRKLETISQIDRRERAELLQAMGVSASAGIIVLLLAAAGLYALVAMNVSQRRREIGIRVTVGACPEQVVRMFLLRGVRLTVIGLCIGLPLGVAGLYLFTMQIRGMPTASYVPIVLSVGAIVLVAASVASWLPARRAAQVDPMVALRSM